MRSRVAEDDWRLSSNIPYRVRRIHRPTKSSDIHPASSTTPKRPRSGVSKRPLQSLQTTRSLLGSWVGGMPQLKLPRTLPISPLSLRCPFCQAEPEQDCASIEGRYSVVHVARIKKAATLVSLNNSRAKHSRIRASDGNQIYLGVGRTCF
jgi:hypothetical protein